MSPRLAVQVTAHDDGTSRAAVAGELDILTAGSLHDAVSSHVGRRMVIDLSDITFIDSGGARSLLVLRKMALDAGGEIVIGRTSTRAHEVIRTVGLDVLFEIDPDA